MNLLIDSRRYIIIGWSFDVYILYYRSIGTLGSRHTVNSRFIYILYFADVNH